eukprot:scaffold2135_cov46-Attheya_sp.AAC.5
MPPVGAGGATGGAIGSATGTGVGAGRGTYCLWYCTGKGGVSNYVKLVVEAAPSLQVRAPCGIGSED